MAREPLRGPAWLNPATRSWAIPDSKLRFVESFADVLRKHFASLRWDQQTDLVKAGDTLLSAAQISGWLQGDRSIHREHVNRLAWVLARAYYERSEKQDATAIDILDGILNELLQAAGFSAIHGARDLIWSRLAGSSDSRILRVGWVDYESFCVRTSPQRDPEGVAASVMTKLASLIGATLHWEHYKWEEIIPALITREIDVVCPILMVLPSRLFRVQFSTVLPNVTLGINGVLHKEHRRKTAGILPAFITGEVGAELCTLFAPESVPPRAFGSLSEARQALLKNPVVDNRSLCLIADNMICLNLINEYSSELDLLRPRQSPSDILLPVAIAVHPDEPRLLDMINTCIDMLTRTDYFTQLYQTSPYGKELMSIGVISLPKAESLKGRKK